MKILSSIILSSIAMFGAANGLAAVTYTLTDLGSFPDNFAQFQTTGVNNLGQVIGVATTSDAKVSHAFLYSNGETHDLGTLSGLTSYASSINENGQIVGWIGQSDGSISPFLYSNGTMSSLGIPGQAFDINNSGTITGLRHGWGGFVYSNGTVSYFATFGGDSSGAGGINDSGIIVGNARKIDDTFRAFRYSGGDTGEPSNMTDLNSLVSPSDFIMENAIAINSSGQIVGQGKKANKSRAFLFSNGSLIDLGALIAPNGYSSASAINESGQVLGGYSTDSDSGTFLYSNGVMSKLNNIAIEGASGWTAHGASDINDSGQLVTIAISPDSKSHVVLLTPHGSPDPVPVQPAAPTAKVAGKKKIAVETATYPVKGTAAGVVTKVTYRIGSAGAFKKAKGTNKWSFTAKLKPGKNKITVIVEGPGGKAKPVNITVTRAD